MYQIHVGSVLLKEPDRKYICNDDGRSKQILEWNLNSDDLGDEDSLVVVKKTCLYKSDKLNIWLDIFGSLFPKEITDDAKRIAFDLRFEGSVANLSPSLCAMACLYLSSLFHDFKFSSKMNELKEKKREGLLYFGLKPKNYRKTNKMPHTIKKYADLILKSMPEKFEKLQRMWIKMGGLND